MEDIVGTYIVINNMMGLRGTSGSVVANRHRQLKHPYTVLYKGFET